MANVQTKQFPSVVARKLAATRSRRPERIAKGERHSIRADVNLHDFLELKSRLILERVSISEWLAIQIRHAIK